MAVRGFAFVGKVPPLWGSINVWKQLTQGLRPGLYRSIALTGLLYVFFTNQLRCCFDALALTSKVRCIHRNKYDVLTDVTTRTYFSEYTHLLSQVRRTYYRRQLQVETVARSQKGQVKLVLL